MTDREIILSKNAGFCPGVKRADEFVFNLISTENKDAKIFTLGKLIHNRIYNEKLKSLGVLPIEFSEIQPLLEKEHGKVVLITRTHGITKEELIKALQEI